MSKQHPNVKALRNLSKLWCTPSAYENALEWAIQVCEAADKLVNAKGKSAEKAYARLEAAVNGGDECHNGQ